jgi:hypothetical protein
MNEGDWAKRRAGRARLRLVVALAAVLAGLAVAIVLSWRSDREELYLPAGLELVQMTRGQILGTNGSEAFFTSAREVADLDAELRAQGFNCGTTKVPHYRFYNRQWTRSFKTVGEGVILVDREIQLQANFFGIPGDLGALRGKTLVVIGCDWIR